MDVNYTARQFMDRDTITVCHVQQFLSLGKAAHHLCCTLAGLHHLPRPAAITFVPHSFIGENHPRQDFPPLHPCNVTHPSDPDGSTPYSPTSLISGDGNLYSFDACWVNNVRARFTESFGSAGISSSTPATHEEWQRTNTDFFAPTLGASTISQYATVPACTFAAQPAVAPSQTPPRASHQRSTDSVLQLTSTKGGVHFMTVKGLSSKSCELPNTNPLAKENTLAESIEHLRVLMKICFSGVDIFKTLLEEYQHINNETQIFMNVVPGE